MSSTMFGDAVKKLHEELGWLAVQGRDTQANVEKAIARHFENMYKRGIATGLMSADKITRDLRHHLETIERELKQAQAETNTDS